MSHAKPPLSSMPRGERGNTPRVQGFTREVTGRETRGNELAPPVANCCGGRGKLLRRTCECLAAAVKRLKLLGFWRWLTRRSDCLSRCKDTKKIADMQEKRALLFNSFDCHLVHNLLFLRVVLEFCQQEANSLKPSLE